MDVALLRDTFARLAPDADAVAARFYERMFRVYPQVRPLFASIDPPSQRKKLVASLASIVALADRPGELEPLLRQLGESHDRYGVQAHHYPVVTASLLATLADHFGDAWTADVASTWADALRVVSDRMIAAQESLAA